MWVKDGVETLPKVLKRIDEVIPKEAVCHKILVDDHSVDDTVKIAKEFNWQAYPNPETGISSGANEALRHVDTGYFMSFEQDLLLAEDWRLKVPPRLNNPKIAVASGIRFASKPQGVKKLQQYVAKKYRGERSLSPWLRSREMSAFTLGKTLDNTIYRTNVLRSVGGFPIMRVNAGVDTVLAYKIKDAGYEWCVDYNIQSIHLRKGLRDELQHQYWYGTQLLEIWREIREKTGVQPPMNKFGVISRFFLSPFTGVFVALRTHEPSIVIIHPLVKWSYMHGLLDSE